MARETCPTSPDMRHSHLTAPHSFSNATPSLVAETATAVVAAACLRTSGAPQADIAGGAGRGGGGSLG